MIPIQKDAPAFPVHDPRADTYLGLNKLEYMAAQIAPGMLLICHDTTKVTGTNQLKPEIIANMTVELAKAILTEAAKET